MNTCERSAQSKPSDVDAVSDEEVDDAVDADRHSGDGRGGALNTVYAKGHSCCKSSNRCGFRRKSVFKKEGSAEDQWSNGGGVHGGVPTSETSGGTNGTIPCIRVIHLANNFTCAVSVNSSIWSTNTSCVSVTGS